MSYEKRLKDLLGRLVAMSPDPPPYPEEMAMATPPKTSRRLHPGLVFAGTVVVIALLAVPVILLTGGQTPLGFGTSTTTTAPQPATSGPQVSTTTSEMGSTTVPQTTVPATSTWQGTVFLYETPENSFGGNPDLVSVSMEVLDLTGRLGPDSYFTEALAAVGANIPEPMSNSIPEDVQILDIGMDGDTLTAEMNEAFLGGAGGLLADITMLNQLIYTLTYLQPDANVVFTVNGEPVEVFGSEGLILVDPVDRQTFRDDYLGQIVVTDPIADLGEGYRVTGVTRVFEASLTLDVLDGDGNVVLEKPIQATCGTGCWGEFETTIDPVSITPGESSVRLFTYSPQDGSPSEMITLPIPEGGIWSLTAE